MQYTIEYDEKNECLVGRFQGVLNNSSFYSAYVEELKKKAQEHDCLRILHDFRNVRIEMNTMEVHAFSNEMRNEHINPRWKRAMLVGENYLEEARFFETVAVNRGQRVRVFAGYEEAVEWLKG